MQARLDLAAARLGLEPNVIAILRACERLTAGDMPVTEIAFAVGFHDGSYFARMFRRYTGVLPSQYARQHAGHDDR